MKRPLLYLDLTRCLYVGVFQTLIITGVLSAQPSGPGGPDHIHIVNSVGDESDASLADGICKTINNECTLRAAIEQANDTANLTTGGGIVFDVPDEIRFAIDGTGVHTIRPQTPLPNVVDAVRIDGYTQSGASPNTLQVGNDAVLLIELDGSLAGVNADGLFLNVTGSVILGLVINNFGQDGIQVLGFGESEIEGNFIGTDPTGTIARGNGNNGIGIRNSASNRIGGTEPAQRNLISGNGTGVFIGNGPSQNNRVEGNYIGTDASGTNAVPNEYGVLISAEGGVFVYASKNRIGGTAPGAGNLISGNSRIGMEVFRGTQNEILGNLIGTTVDGAHPLPNTSSGVLLFEASTNVVGGLFDIGGSGTITAFKRNVISGNGFAGVEIFVINRPATGNHVVGNFIGTDISGLKPVPNIGGGVFMSSSVGGIGSLTNNTIGGTDGAHATRNIISGNGSGVILVGERVSSNDIVGNFIGLDISGTAKLGNEKNGVRFSIFNGGTVGPIGNFIGTAAPNSGNVISGNGRDGVAITFGSTGNFVLNNYIGLDVLGTVADPDGIPNTGDELGNTRHGVAIFDSPLNSVGDGTLNHRNVISGNMGSGVFIGTFNDPGSATDNTITGNFIGVDSLGGGTVGNHGDGILIEDAPGNIIGGDQTDSGNIISGNQRDGVHISGALSDGNVLSRNLIGVEFDSSTHNGNARHGIFVADGADNVIGAGKDVVSGLELRGNQIAHNGGSGVVIESGIGNTIRANQIYDNGGLGIDLAGDGLTENDAGDGDSGPNGLQNYPIVVAKRENGTTSLTLDMDTAPNTVYLFDIYTDDLNRDVFGVQGRTYLTTIASPGGATTHYHVTTAVPGSHRNFSVTATDPNGNTSELGREQLVHSVEFTQAIQTFQPLDELQSMLDNTGEPPVPMIAGKPGTMRVYLRQLTDSATVDFEVDGLEVDFVSIATASTRAGCTPKDRRRRDRNCDSVDFDFGNPPQGPWTTTLTILTPAGDVFERHRFRQVTRTAKTLVLDAASVCHDLDAQGNWICGDEKLLKTLTGQLRAIAPTHNVRVEESHHVTAYRLTLTDLDGDGIDIFPNPILGDLYEQQAWIDQVKNDLVILSLVSKAQSLTRTGEQRYTYGMMQPLNNFPGGSAWIGGPSAFGMQSDFAFASSTLAHETGHMLGRKHTNRSGGSTSNPVCSDVAPDGSTDWPFCDSSLQSHPVPCTGASTPTATPEVGYNVAKHRPILPEKAFDVMSYCEPKWITAFTYVNMAQGGLAPRSGGVLDQSGPAPGPIQGAFWLVAGELGTGTAKFRPLMEFDATALDSPGVGSHRIEIRDVNGVVLSTRFFEPMIASTEIEEGGVDVLNVPFFAELIPVQVGARSIVVIDALNVELGTILLGGVAPVVTVNYAPGVDPQSGPQTIEWSIIDPDSAEHTAWVQYSNDNGVTWQTLSLSVTLSSLRIDFDKLPGADGSAIIRVNATDGVNSGFDDSVPFSVATKLPQVEIFFPATGTVFRRGQLVWLQAAASDGDDGSLDDAAVVWASSLDGNIGQGADLPITSLSVGTHTITATATDTDGNMATHNIDIVVEDSPIVETPFVINVPADQPTIQAGIDAAFSGDEVLVAPGTYEEMIVFHGKAITVRSSGGAAVTIIDATNVPDPGNGKPVVRCDSGERDDTVLDGFTLTGGTGATVVVGGSSSGGGMFINNSSPTVANCTFSGNTATFGGGMYVFSGSATVTKCNFVGNSAGSSGGGMQSQSSSNMLVTECMFSGNTAWQGGGMSNFGVTGQTVSGCTFSRNTAASGGAIYNFDGTQVVSGCTFTENEAQSSGGGLYQFSGSLTMTDCAFIGNTSANAGGGILNAARGSSTVTRCTFIGNASFNGGAMNNGSSSPTVTDSMFSGNTATNDGGGIYNSLASPTLTNCTFSGNTADAGGGLFNSEDSSPSVTSCIFWMNSDAGGTGESAQILDDPSCCDNVSTVSYSNVQGGWTGLAGAGNINADPLFMDADGPDNIVGTSDDDLRLRPGSPCIDSGDPAFIAAPDETDLDNHVRVLCGRVEMGAYEFAGDFDCNQTFDLTDFASWDACMTGPGGGPYLNGCATFDCDGDLDIDMQDFMEFENFFLP